MNKSNQVRDTQDRTILIICPHLLVREGLGFLFSRDEDVHLAGLAAEVGDALDVLYRNKPDATVLVFVSEFQDCISTIERLKTNSPDLPILVVSADHEYEAVQSALKAGASGYLPLDVDKDELVQGIYAVSRGEVFLHSSVVVTLLAQRAAPSSEENIVPRQEDFSPREQEILSHLTHGMSDREIAQTLFISVRTVQSHLVHIYEKMGVHSRTEAALLAVRAGWTSLSEAEGIDGNQ